MKLSLRILLGYFLIVGLAAYVVLNVFRDEVKPGVRQAMEETLVDTANILAELAAADLKAGRIANGAFAQAVSAAVKREVNADIWGIQKQKLDYRVYVTNGQGVVVFDSEGKAVGEDYSRWIDVYRTLRGQYGARSTKLSPSDDSSSVMHIAAPIKAGEKIIGVLTIARPNANLQPFVDRSQQKIRNWGLALLAASAAIGLFFTWRLTRSLNRLRRYARDVADGHKVPPPESGNTEIAELGRALEAMREKLEGKQYIEQYVHTLTHELKSPVAAIQGAAELLDEEMPRPARATFLANIREQCTRLSQIAERMLSLAQLEHQQRLQSPEPLELTTLLKHTAQSLQPRLEAAGLTLRIADCPAVTVIGEAFLLRQAIANLLDNAIDFSPPGSTITVACTLAGQQVVLQVRDHGPGIPDYASERLFERFYSLPRPGSGKKSTGLGLPFVREVAALHGGSITLNNAEGGGALACLTLPLAP